MVVLALLISAVYQQLKSQSNSSSNGLDLVDKARKIRKPADYRDRYQAPGTYAVRDSKGDERHYTYASPGAAEELDRLDVQP